MARFGGQLAEVVAVDLADDGGEPGEDWRMRRSPQRRGIHQVLFELQRRLVGILPVLPEGANWAT